MDIVYGIRRLLLVADSLFCPVILDPQLFVLAHSDWHVFWRLFSVFHRTTISSKRVREAKGMRRHQFAGLFVMQRLADPN